MKKVFIIIFLFMTLFIAIKPNKNIQITYAEENDVYNTIINKTEKEIEDLDLTLLEEVFNETSLSEDYSFKSFLNKLIKGEESLDFNFLLKVILSGAKEGFANSKNIILILAIFSLLSAMFNMFAESKGNLQLYKYINLAFLVIAVSIISYKLTDYIALTKETITKIDDVVSATFPILIALMVTLGAANSSIMFKPIIAVFINIILKAITGFVLSLVVLYFILTILNEISENIKLTKFKNLIHKIVKYVITTGFGLFVGYLSLNGIVASSGDNLSIKATKYALKNYIPLIGGYLSDSVEIFKLGCILLKNSIGVSVIIIFLYYLLSFILPIVVVALGLGVIASLCEMFGNKKMSSFLSGSANTFKILIGIIVAVFVLLFILLIFVVMTANSL